MTCRSNKWKQFGRRLNLNKVKRYHSGIIVALSVYMHRILIISVLLLGSCVSSNKYNKVVQTNQRLAKKNREFTRRIDSLENVIAMQRDELSQYESDETDLPMANAEAEREREMAREWLNEWSDPKYKDADVAAKLSYLKPDEKEFFRLWNLCRMNPPLFLKTYLVDIYKKDPKLRTTYEASLVKTMMNMEPKPIILPDKTLFDGARCHAYNSGKVGYVGHNRGGYAQACQKNYNAECCSYGNLDPRGHLENLLVDEGVSSLGHREAMFGSYKYAGISFQPHTSFGENVVIDMSYAPRVP